MSNIARMFVLTLLALVSAVPVVAATTNPRVDTSGVNAQPPYPYEFTLPATMKVVGTGTTANFTNRLLFKATTNADGEVTYSFFGGESTCQ